MSKVHNFSSHFTFFVDDFGEIIRLVSNVLTDNCLSGALAILFLFFFNLKYKYEHDILFSYLQRIIYLFYTKEKKLQYELFHIRLRRVARLVFVCKFVFIAVDLPVLGRIFCVASFVLRAFFIALCP